MKRPTLDEIKSVLYRIEKAEAELREAKSVVEGWRYGK